MEAHQWLDTQDEILTEATFEQGRNVRAHVNLLYYRGVALFKEEKLSEAKNIFSMMIEEAESINWQRGVVNAQNWLADIAIIEGDLECAEEFLQTGLPIVNRNKDKRRAAYYKRSFAFLERQKGDLKESSRWCNEATMDFDRLGMQPEAEEMKSFALQLNKRHHG
jgi:hypothetical protein